MPQVRGFGVLGSAIDRGHAGLCGTGVPGDAHEVVDPSPVGGQTPDLERPLGATVTLAPAKIRWRGLLTLWPAGAIGYLLKDCDGREVLAAIRSANEPSRSTSPTSSAALA